MAYTRVLLLKSPTMYGDDVKDVQKNLNGLDLNVGAVDGYYGQKCVDNVKVFQRAFNLSVDGQVGSKTWNALIAEIKRIQNQLTAKGYRVTADGYFGSGTITVVKNFQKSLGFTQTGTINTNTRLMLFAGGAITPPVTPPPSTGLPYVAPIKNSGTKPVSQTKASSTAYNQKTPPNTFGAFYYKDGSGGAVTRDSGWDGNNLIYIPVSSVLTKKSVPANVTKINVNKHVKGTWETVVKRMEHAINAGLITSWDGGTAYAKHMSGNVNNPISNHAWGVAIDINAGDYPQKASSKVTNTNDKQWKIWEYIFKDLGFKWGNDFSGSQCDPMHFELTKV